MRTRNSSEWEREIAFFENAFWHFLRTHRPRRNVIKIMRFENTFCELLRTRFNMFWERCFRVLIMWAPGGRQSRRPNKCMATFGLVFWLRFGTRFAVFSANYEASLFWIECSLSFLWGTSVPRSFCEGACAPGKFACILMQKCVFECFLDEVVFVSMHSFWFS